MRLLAPLGLALLLAVCPATTPALAQAPNPATQAPAAPARTPPPASPKKASPGTKQAVSADGRRVDVNAASEAELMALPGVGPVRAKALVAGRPYDSIEAVGAKKALPAGVLSALRGRLALANINTSTAREMQQTLPGIGDVRAGQIVAGRPYAAPEELVAKGILTQAAFDKVKDLLTF